MSNHAFYNAKSAIKEIERKLTRVKRSNVPALQFQVKKLRVDVDDLQEQEAVGELRTDVEERLRWKEHVALDTEIPQKTPRQVPGLHVHLDASDADSMIYDGNGQLVGVYDISGNNRHFSVWEDDLAEDRTGTLEYLPANSDNFPYTLANKGVLSFFNHKPLRAALDSSLVGETAPFCVFIVMQQLQPYTAEVNGRTQSHDVGLNIFGGVGAGRMNAYWGNTAMGQSVSMLQGAANNIPSVNDHRKGFESGATMFMMQYNVADAIVEGWANGQMRRTRDTDNRREAYVYIGTDVHFSGVVGEEVYFSNLPLRGCICEVVVFDSALTDADAQGVHNYLAYKWGVYEPKIADYFTIAGQSNAVGRGDASLSPEVYRGHFIDTYWRQNTKTGIDILADPVGVAEGLDMATDGSAWPAFANEYFALTGREAIFGHCAKGGSSLFNSTEWLMSNKDNNYIHDLVTMLPQHVARIQRDYRFNLKYKFVIWHQGETDDSQTKEDYKAALISLAEYAVESGYDTFLYYEISKRNNNDFQSVRDAQREAYEGVEAMHLVWNGCANFKERGRLSDGLHYTQIGYNEMGRGGAQGAVKFLDTLPHIRNLPPPAAEVDLSGIESRVTTLEGFGRVVYSGFHIFPMSDTTIYFTYAALGLTWSSGTEFPYIQATISNSNILSSQNNVCVWVHDMDTVPNGEFAIRRNFTTANTYVFIQITVV